MHFPHSTLVAICSPDACMHPFIIPCWAESTDGLPNCQPKQLLCWGEGLEFPPFTPLCRCCLFKNSFKDSRYPWTQKWNNTFRMCLKNWKQLLEKLGSEVKGTLWDQFGCSLFKWCCIFKTKHKSEFVELFEASSFYKVASVWSTGLPVCFLRIDASNWSGFLGEPLKTFIWSVKSHLIGLNSESPFLFLRDKKQALS